MTDATDNIIKMAIAIIGPNSEEPELNRKLELLLDIEIEDEENSATPGDASARLVSAKQTITERVSKVDAEKLLSQWKQILVAEMEKTGRDDLLDDEEKFLELKTLLYTKSD